MTRHRNTEAGSCGRRTCLWRGVLITLTALTLLATFSLNTEVQILRSSTFSAFSMSVAEREAATLRGFFGLSLGYLMLMALVFWLIRKLRPYAAVCSDIAALAWFVLTMVVSVPTGLASWTMGLFDLSQFAPSRFILFMVEVGREFENYDGDSLMPMVVVKTLFTLALPALYLSTFYKPLAPIKAVRIA